MKSVDKYEPVLSVAFTGEVAEKWATGLDRADPLVTPILGPLRLLKERGIRVDGITGTYDVLSPDTLVLIEKLQEMDVDGTWLVWEKQMHCFPLAWWDMTFKIGSRLLITGAVGGTGSQTAKKAQIG